jgi:glycosyltransferase involved in cell wall biosynthesis
MVSDKAQPADGVEWLPRPTDAELERLYAEAWVFCLPSTYEGYGIPYVEAMARGAAVVATPNPGSARLILDGVNGLLPEDERMGEAIVELLGDAQMRAALGTAAQTRARRFSWEVIAERHERAYRVAIRRFCPTATTASAADDTASMKPSAIPRRL